MRKKKIILIALAAMLLAAFLCGCGEKTFRCGLCGREVTQKPHTYSVLGQEVEICNSCYNTLTQ